MVASSSFAHHRKSIGASLEECCLALGLSPTCKGMLSEIERGKRNASLKLALEIEIWSQGAVAASSVSKAAAALDRRRDAAKREAA